MMLEGRTILVTGASSGIGAAIAKRLASQGASLILAGRDDARLAREHCSARIHRVDLSDERATLASAAHIAADCERLDALVHAAGAYSTTGFAHDDGTDFATLLQTNVGAVFTLTQALLPQLERARGHVVVINSTVIARPARGLAQYAASKHALKGLTDALREEANPRGIRVTSIYPGRTATPMQAAAHAAEGKSYEPERLLQPEDVAELVAFAITLPRTAELVDVTIRPTHNHSA